MKSKLTTILEEFSGLLGSRFRTLEEQDTSEDDIRYMFFFACSKNGIDLNDIILEKKDVFEDQLKEKAPKLDALVYRTGKAPCLAVEFKYHRQEMDTKPRLYWAGRLLYDLFRLQKVRCIGGTRPTKLAIYVANEQMMKKFENCRRDTPLRIAGRGLRRAPRRRFGTGGPRGRPFFQPVTSR